MSNPKNAYGLPLDCFEAINKSLSEESDRARIIIIACWIDEFLKVKLMNVFSKGNREARKTLFTNNGPFATFAAKINVAFCAGWIERDVYHDIQIIRKLRNICAHTYDPVSLDEEEARKLLESLRVPHRQIYDWSDLRLASTDDGIIFYTGKKPPEVKEDLDIPGELTLKMALPVVLVVLASNLGILFGTHKEGESVIIELPKHMQLGQQSDPADP